MKSHFHNHTINASGQMLVEFEAAAKTDECLVLDAFRKAGKPMAWFEVMNMIPVNVHEVSLKRAITTLCNDVTDKEGNVARPRMLVKTDESVIGIYGKPCRRYELL